MVGSNPRMSSNLLCLVPLLRVLVEQPQDEVLRRTTDVLPLPLRELNPPLLYLLEEKLFVVRLKRRFST